MDGKRLMVIGLLLFMSTGSNAFAHCQIPCGIYDDSARFSLMEEHVATIEKSIRQINELSGQKALNMNQIVRWVQNKDDHADKLSGIVTHYFMTQRVKSVERANKEAHTKYINEITWLHQLIVYSMKAKQSADLKNVEKLKTLITSFKASYLGE